MFLGASPLAFSTIEVGNARFPSTAMSLITSRADSSNTTRTPPGAGTRRTSALANRPVA